MTLHEDWINKLIFTKLPKVFEPLNTIYKTLGTNCTLTPWLAMDQGIGQGMIDKFNPFNSPLKAVNINKRLGCRLIYRHWNLPPRVKAEDKQNGKVNFKF